MAKSCRRSRCSMIMDKSGGYRGSSGGSLNPSPLTVPYKYPIKMKKNGLSETKFYLHGIFKKIERNPAKRTPYLYTYEPPFQKSWIRHCTKESNKVCTRFVIFNHFLSVISMAYHDVLSLIVFKLLLCLSSPNFPSRFAVLYFYINQLRPKYFYKLIYKPSYCNFPESWKKIKFNF